MPTKKKRIGFIPREDVMRIINDLSIENNLSNSKIISILVEEALSKRGIINKRTGKETKSYINIRQSLASLSGQSSDSNNIENFTINTKFVKHNNQSKTNLIKQTNHDSFDFQTYKRFLSFLKFQEMVDDLNT